MTSFKQFVNQTALFEGIVSKWDIREKSVDQAIRILNKNCKQGLLAIKNGGLLWRGFGIDRENAKDFELIDTTNSLRTSRDYDNAYMLLMDASKHMKHFPSRSNSLICTTSIDTAREYNKTSMGATAVIPFDGTKIAHTNGNSDFNQVVSSSELLDEIGISSFLVTIELRNFFKLIASPTEIKLGPNNKTLEFTDHTALDRAMSKYNPLQLTLLWGIGIGAYRDSIRIPDNIALGKVKSAELAISNYFHLPRNALENGVWKNKIYKQSFDNMEKALNSKLAKLQRELVNFYKLIKAAPADERFTYLASKTIKPHQLNLRLVVFGTRVPFDTECWVAGKAMLVSEKMMIKILAQLYKEDRNSVHSSYLGLFGFTDTK